MTSSCPKGTVAQDCSPSCVVQSTGTLRLVLVLFAGNAQAPFFLSQALAPTLKQHQGCIINIIDALLDQPDINFIPYTMAKTALRTMTLGLAKALAS